MALGYFGSIQLRGAGLHESSLLQLILLLMNSEFVACCIRIVSIIHEQPIFSCLSALIGITIVH